MAQTLPLAHTSTLPQFPCFYSEAVGINHSSKPFFAQLYNSADESQAVKAKASCPVCSRRIFF